MKNISENTKGILIALLAIFLFSSKAILVKMLYVYEMPTIHILLLRMLFAVPFFIMIMFYKKRDNVEQVKRSDYVWVVVFGVMGYYVASFFDFWGLKYLTASIERIILFVYPTLVVVLGAVFLKTKITKQQMIAIVVTYIGVVVTFSAELHIHQDESLFLGAGLIFMSALTYAGYLVGSGWLIPKFGTVKFTSMAMMIACLSVMIHYFISDRGDLFHYELAVYGWALVMAVFCTVIPSYLVSYAINKLGSSTFSIIGSIGPVFTIVLAALVLGERITFVQMIGVAVVIVGVRIVAQKSKK